MIEYRISPDNETDVQVISLSFIKSEFFKKVTSYEDGNFLSENNFNINKIKEIKRNNPEKINSGLSLILKSVCKINVSDCCGYGFFIKLFKGDKPFYCLMTNEHLINDDIIESKKSKIIIYNNGINSILTLNKENRFIQNFSLLDISIVELLNERDNIDESYFLQPCLDNPSDLKDKNIFIQFFNEFSRNFSISEILKIDKYKFFFDGDTKIFSGIPIFLEDCFKVVGISVGYDKFRYYNFGNMIFPIINWINGNEIYYKDQYEGEYVNDKFEGKGKYTYITGNYYIGEFKNGKRNGKGKQYYKNGDLMHEGNWVDDIFISKACPLK